MNEQTIQDRLRLSCNRRNCNCTSSQAAREIDRLQAGMADAIRRAEKAEAELKAMGAEQEPLLYIQFSDCGEFIRFWTKSKQRMQAQQASVPEPKMVALYAHLIPAASNSPELDGIKKDEAFEINRMNRLIAADPKMKANHTPQPVTVGGAAYPIPAEWLDVMKELADDAEYACDIQYPYRGRYHRDMVKYNAEMAIVHRARELLERAK